MQEIGAFVMIRCRHENDKRVKVSRITIFDGYKCYSLILSETCYLCLWFYRYQQNISAWHISSCFRPWRQFLAHWRLGRWQRGLLEVAQWRRGVRHKSDYHRPIRTWPTRLQRPQPEKYSNTDGEVWNHQTTDLWMAKLDLIFFVCLQRSEGFIVVWNVVFAYKMNHKHDFVFILTINNLYKSLLPHRKPKFISLENQLYEWSHESIIMYI